MFSPQGNISLNLHTFVFLQREFPFLCLRCTFLTLGTVNQITSYTSTPDTGCLTWELESCQATTSLKIVTPLLVLSAEYSTLCGIYIQTDVVSLNTIRLQDFLCTRIRLVIKIIRSHVIRLQRPVQVPTVIYRPISIGPDADLGCTVTFRESWRRTPMENVAHVILSSEECCKICATDQV